VSQQKVIIASQQQVHQDLLVGRPLKRKEDPRLLTGRSMYVDDMKLPDMLHAAVLRSPYAHAKIKSVDAKDALSASGVRLVFTATDLPKELELPIQECDDGTKITRPVLASSEVSYAGEPIAFIVAESRYEAEDAIELIHVDYEQLPAVVDPLVAMKEGAPKIHESLKSNIVKTETVASGDIDDSFRKASKIVSLDLLNQRLAPSPIETRAFSIEINARRNSRDRGEQGESHSSRGRWRIWSEA
jgi:aerobic carbon-monoxide dehydrogenase large subunit